MNPDPSQPQTRTSPALQPLPRQQPLDTSRQPAVRPSAAAPAPVVTATPVVAPTLAPTPAPITEPVAAPAPAFVPSPVSLVPQPEPATPPTPAQPPAEASFRQHALVPLDEAAVIRERALADAAIVRPQPETPAVGEGIDPMQSPVETASTALDNHGLPPVDDDSKPTQVDTNDDERMSIVRRIISGILVVIAWTGVVYGLNYAFLRVFSEMVKSDPAGVTGNAEQIASVAATIPYAAIVIVALAAIPVFAYPRGFRKIVFSLGATAFIVGLIETVVRIPGISDQLMTPLSAAGTIFSDSEYTKPFIGRAWISVGVAVALGVIGVFAVYALMRLSGKLPKTIGVIVFILAALVPIGTFLALEKLTERAFTRGEPAYSVVEEGGKKRIVGASGLGEGKRLFIGTFYEGYQEEAFTCLKGAYSMGGATTCATSCADKVQGECVDVHFRTAKTSQKIESHLEGAVCTLDSVSGEIGQRALAALVPEGFYKQKPAVPCTDVTTPGGQKVRTATQWAGTSGQSSGSQGKVYVFIKDGMVAYVQLWITVVRNKNTLPEVKKVSEEKVLKFIDTFTITNPHL